MERVFLLIEGSPAALELTFGLNLFKEEEDLKSIEFSLLIQNIWIEQTIDLVRNLAEVGIAFNHTSKLSNYVISSAEGIQRSVELFTPLYLVKEAFELEILEEEKMVKDQKVLDHRVSKD